MSVCVVGSACTKHSVNPGITVVTTILPSRPSRQPILGSASISQRFPTCPAFSPDSQDYSQIPQMHFELQRPEIEGSKCSYSSHSFPYVCYPLIPLSGVILYISFSLTLLIWSFQNLPQVIPFFFNLNSLFYAFLQEFQMNNHSVLCGVSFP